MWGAPRLKRAHLCAVYPQQMGFEVSGGSRVLERIPYARLKQHF